MFLEDIRAIGSKELTWKEEHMIAHIREKDKCEQTLQEHSASVGALCARQALVMKLENTALLIGLLHDFGKGTGAFERYLRWSADHPDKEPPASIPHPNHAAAGATFAYERWYAGGNAIEKLTAQIIALCICGHHTGLHDCLNEKGESGFLDTMLREKRQIFYEEAMTGYLNAVISAERLDELFTLACEEVRQYAGKWEPFNMGLLTRWLLSVLVDADRWDSACFNYGVEPEYPVRVPNWRTRIEKYELYAAENFSGRSDLDRIRGQISDICAEKAAMPTGLYQLSVPTGGGKTLTSLRYALLHAEHNQLSRIFYVIPYNTILDQNAQDIRSALGNDPSILEHHSNVVQETEEEQAAYRRLSERWDSDIILTSLVHFLNSLFHAKNSDARRMRQLTDAVIIFDEIQSLPVNCKALFECAVTFLTRECHSTVLLCTATQPQLDFNPPPIELMQNADELYGRLRRVSFIPELDTVLTFEQAAERVARFVHAGRATLFIVNTKAAAWQLYVLTRQKLKECGNMLIQAPAACSEEALKKQADSAAPDTVLCIHLSTLMCPAHRAEQLQAVKAWTKSGKKVLCVSTALIEAGINVSFPVVVRSLAGLPSVIQAGGRCNRNMEWPLGGETYIWNLGEEKLQRLPDIQRGKNIGDKLLRSLQNVPDEISLPPAMRQYFAEERLVLGQQIPNSLRYPYKEWGSDLVELLSVNPICRRAAIDLHPELRDKLTLIQSFRTSGNAFKVIDQQTKSVLVPYGEGRELITQLCGAHGLKKQYALLKKAQAYSVNLFSNVYDRLAAEGALTPLGDTGVVALRENYYDVLGGVRTEAGELELMCYSHLYYYELDIPKPVVYYSNKKGGGAADTSICRPQR